MTQEEKAKAYDEALERAKQLQHNNAFVTTVFPELKESEDERMRKEIIEYLNSQIPIAEENELLCFKQWISWLEKQKEQIRK